MTGSQLPTRRLGSSEISVGAVGLGCMGMSWGYSAGERDDARSIAVIHRALELGCNLLDTSDMYGPFTNEELIGRALADRRDQAVIATKVGLVVDDPKRAEVHRDGRPEHVRSAIDASLRRLGTDHVDLYQLHRVDPAVPIEETWGAMSELVTAGKVRALGLSETSIEELVRATAVHPVATLQSELSLWTREALAEIVPWCAEHDVAFISFSPLGRGFLTGRLDSERLEPGDVRTKLPRFEREAAEANQAIVDRIEQIAAASQATPGQVALAWVLAQGEQVVPIPGTKQISYLEENLAAAELALSVDDLAALDRLPAPIGERYGGYSP